MPNQQEGGALPPIKTPDKPDTKPDKPDTKPDAPDAKPDTPDAPGADNGPIEVTAEQLVIFYLKEARELHDQKLTMYQRIQHNRDTLRALAQHPNINDAQKKIIAEMYPVKKGGGRKKNSDTPAKTPTAPAAPAATPAAPAARK